MCKNLEYGLIIFFILFSSASYAGDVYQSVYCTFEEIENTADNFGFIFQEEMVPVFLPTEYQHCFNAVLYRDGADLYQMAYPKETEVCSDSCKDYVSIFGCDFGCPEDPVETEEEFDPVYIHLAGLAGCLLGFLFGLALILGSYYS